MLVTALAPCFFPPLDNKIIFSSEFCSQNKAHFCCSALFSVENVFPAINPDAPSVCFLMDFYQPWNDMANTILKAQRSSRPRINLVILAWFFSFYHSQMATFCNRHCRNCIWVLHSYDVRSALPLIFFGDSFILICRFSLPFVHFPWPIWLNTSLRALHLFFFFMWNKKSSEDGM